MNDGNAIEWTDLRFRKKKSADAAAAELNLRVFGAAMTDLSAEEVFCKALWVALDEAKNNGLGFNRSVALMIHTLSVMMDEDAPDDSAETES